MRLLLVFLILGTVCLAQKKDTGYLLQPDRVFDGEKLITGVSVFVHNDKIVAIGPTASMKPTGDVIVIKLPGCTLLPGLIEGHSHLLLHPYNETSWNDQVMKEPDAYRVARATVHAKNTLMAGFTTVRDLGTEGAGYADVGLKMAIEDGIIPGPRMIVAGRAIVATGSYGPKGFDTDFTVMLGAEPADGNNLIHVVRDQIGKGADVVKVYADYRWGLNDEARPSFSIDELKLIVETATSSGRPVVAHASTAEGMRRAIMAGVSTIEHGDGGTLEIFQLMKEKGVALCPTIAAGYAVAQYKGWQAGTLPEPDGVKQKRTSYQAAIQAEVKICAGGDVGVFAHGDNVRELEMMTEYGMMADAVLRSATSVNADVFGIGELTGRIKENLKADILVVQGDPTKNISDLRKVRIVLKDGFLYRNESEIKSK
ncbi:MAG TPA: amidohydrolase family protein [Cyclobacteriaceae bacterium]|nr:amidohydrolase family protein [Cyclobacteriaceae bacterium]